MFLRNKGEEKGTCLSMEIGNVGCHGIQELKERKYNHINVVISFCVLKQSMNVHTLIFESSVTVFHFQHHPNS